MSEQATSEHPRFILDIDQNQFLPAGGTEVHAVLTVTATGAARLAATSTRAAEVIIIDTSASMDGAKIGAAREAARTAVETLRDGTLFAVVAGTSMAWQVFPRAEGTLAAASPSSREKAATEIGRLRPSNGTALGPWLRLAADLLRPHEGLVRHAVMLTDGHGPLSDDDLAHCSGVFTCDCFGVGDGWEPRELRRVSQALLGSFREILDPADLAGYFRSLTERAMGKAVPEVALRLRVPAHATLRAVTQVHPTELDLTGKRTEVAPMVGDYPTAAWGDESREYQIRVDVPAGTVGEPPVRAAQVRLVVPEDGTELARGNILTEWTDDLALSTRVSPKVAHYTGQLEQNELIRDGLQAFQTGDTATATAKLGRARQLAEDSGRAEIVRAIDRVVDHDPATGTVRLRGSVSRADQIALDAGTDRTVLLGERPPDGPRGGDGEPRR